MDIFEKLQPLTSQIRNKLFNSVKYSFPDTLKEPLQYFLNTPGKYIRPLFTLLSAQLVGGNVDKVIPAAVGIELFHDFTLIHDDIMDNDDLRRGFLTIHKKWDQGTAILVGDALVGMAYESMLECESKYIPSISKLFSQAIIRVCEGQALDKEFEKRQDVSLDEYLPMISKKTAWLLKLACQVGGILGDGKQNQIQLLADFGHNLGIGFQIQDDLLDFMADEKILGKHVGSDYQMDKKTYVTLKYQEVVKGKRDSFLNYPLNIADFDTLGKLKKALIDLKIVEETQGTIDLYFSRALQSLSKVTQLDQENTINQLIDFLRFRDY